MRPVALHHIHLAGWLDLPIPAEPQGFARAHNIGKGNSYAAGPSGLAQIQHAIRDQNDPAHIPLRSRLAIHGLGCMGSEEKGYNDL